MIWNLLSEERRSLVSLCRIYFYKCRLYDTIKEKFSHAYAETDSFQGGRRATQTLVTASEEFSLFLAVISGILGPAVQLAGQVGE